MNSRKKLIISLSSLGLAIVAAIGITFGVLAAQNQAVTNTFTVSYSANNVKAYAYAKYMLGGQSSYTYFTGSETTHTVDNTSVSAVYFDPTNAQSSNGSLTVSGGITLNANPASYAIMVYAFENAASVGGTKMTVALADSSNQNAGTYNVNIYYYSSSNSSEEVATIKGATQFTAEQWAEKTEGEIETLYTEQFPEGEATTVADKKAALEAVPGIITPANLHIGNGDKTMTSAQVNPGSTIYFHILVEIVDNSLNAGYTSDTTTTSSKGIRWTLTGIAPQA